MRFAIMPLPEFVKLTSPLWISRHFPSLVVNWHRARCSYIVAMAASNIVRARIDGVTKEKASAALAAMGLSVSDAIRMMMHRVAEEQKLPFEVRVPNRESVAAVAELDAGKGQSFASADALFDDFGI